MGLFHFARKKRVPVPSAAAQSDTAPLDLQAFSLEPILTPSGLVDAPDHTLNGMDWVDHPGTDWHNSDLAALPDSRHVDVTPAHTTDASAAHPTATGDHDLVLSGSGYGSAQTETTAQPLTGGGYGDAGTQAPTTQSDDGHANTPVSTTPTAPTATTTTVLPAVDHAIASPASASVVGAAVAPQPLVGIIDTGFAAQNPHLDYSHITLGHDYVDGDNNPLLQPGRGNDHGTGILGIVEATQNHGVEGLHEATPIWLGRATGSGHWADSLVEFVNHAQATGTPHAVVNLSFDLTQTNPDGSVSTRFAFTPQELAALHYAHDNQILIVTAAGNQGGAMSALGQASQPFDNIITVGAADGMGRADYSSYGAGLDLLANGGTPEHPILTTMGEGRGAVAGSSAAAAQVTGAVSLVWQANPGLSYRQVIDLLEHAATDVGTAGWDATTGFGVINLAAAIDLAKQTPPDTAGATANFMPIPWATSDDLLTGERPTDDWSEPLPDTASGDGAAGGTDAPATPPEGSDTTGDDSAQTDATPADGAEGTAAGQDAADQATDAPPESDMSGDEPGNDAAGDVPTDEPEGDSTENGSEPTGDSPDDANAPEPDAPSASNPPPDGEPQGGYDLGYSYGFSDGSGFREGISSWSGYSLYNLYGGGGWFASATFLADYLASYNKGFIDGWIYTDTPPPSDPPEENPDPTAGDPGNGSSGTGYGNEGGGDGSEPSGNGYGSSGDGYGSEPAGNGYGSTGDGYGSNDYGGNGYGNDYGSGYGDSSTGSGDGSNTSGDNSGSGDGNDSTGNDYGGDISEADNGVTTADPGIGAGSTGADDGSDASGNNTGTAADGSTDPTTGSGDDGTLEDSGDDSDPIGTDAGNGSAGDATPDDGGDGTIPSGAGTGDGHDPGGMPDDEGNVPIGDDTGDGHNPSSTPSGNSDAPTGTDSGDGHDADLTPGNGGDGTAPTGTNTGNGTNGGTTPGSDGDSDAPTGDEEGGGDSGTNLPLATDGTLVAGLSGGAAAGTACGILLAAAEGVEAATVAGLPLAIGQFAGSAAIIAACVIGGSAAEDAAKGLLDSIFAAQRGKQGNQADTGILAEADELIAQGREGQEGKPKDREEALDQLDDQARREGNTEKRLRITKTRKALGLKRNRQSPNR